MNTGGSINFQKASCTLDGCVKIYTSRVDSVASETSRLLSGLADNKHGKRNNDDEDDGEDEDGNEIAGKNKSKKAIRYSGIV
jgi:condensin complex subunit 2